MTIEYNYQWDLAFLTNIIYELIGLIISLALPLII